MVVAVVMVDEEEGEEVGVVGGEGEDDAVGGGVVVVVGMRWKSGSRGLEWGRRRWVEEEAKLHGCRLECAITIAATIIYPFNSSNFYVYSIQLLLQHYLSSVKKT